MTESLVGGLIVIMIASLRLSPRCPQGGPSLREGFSFLKDKNPSRSEGPPWGHPRTTLIQCQNWHWHPSRQRVRPRRQQQQRVGFCQTTQIRRAKPRHCPNIFSPIPHLARRRMIRRPLARVHDVLRQRQVPPI